MSWHVIAKLPNRGLIFWAVADGGMVFVREADGLSCYDLSDQARTRWSWDCPADHVAGYKPLVLTAQAVVTAAYPHEAAQHMVLYAFDRITGQLLWERPVAWSLYHITGDLLGNTDRLALIENDASPRLLVLDALTGSEMSSGPGVQTHGTSSWQHRTQSGVCSNGWLYYAAQGEGLYRMDLAAPQPTLIKVLDEPAYTLIEDGPEIYVQQAHPGESTARTLIMLDAATGAVQSRITLPAHWETKKLQTIRPASHAHVFLLYESVRGLALLDLAQQQVRWHCGKAERWHFLDVVETPYGVFGCVKSLNDSFCVHLDRRDGHVIHTIPLRNIRYMYWVDGYLLASSIFHSYVLCWNDEERAS